MSKAKMYGMNRQCVPNRDADRRRENRFFRSKENWTWNHEERLEKRNQDFEIKEIERMKLEAENA